MRILVIDNYDSFTYNLVHLINECGYEATVWRNDKFELDEAGHFDKIVLSPGPGIPSEAGLLLDVIRNYSATKSILGVCLGMQAIAEVFGGELYNLSRPVHGRATRMQVTDTHEGLFSACPNEFNIGRYHSWAVKSDNFPSGLTVTARDHEGVIMALRHNYLDVRGVQFHPESVLTEHGRQMMKNWLEAKPLNAPDVEKL
ncbi:MAG TPA: aminodeoxychorismate/anthranilate synthase component II [Sphingobacteriaceae bacterium]